MSHAALPLLETRKRHNADSRGDNNLPTRTIGRNVRRRDLTGFGQPQLLLGANKGNSWSREQGFPTQFQLSLANT